MGHRAIVCLVLSLLLSCIASAGESLNRITILYDAFGRTSELQMDWGFAALVEYGGKRILYDTGNNAERFERNAKTLEVTLQRLDFVVISDSHGDHTSGLTYLLRVNPALTVYIPRGEWGLFGGGSPLAETRGVESLPAHMRYFGGTPPEDLRLGNPWPQGKFVVVDRLTQVAPGIHLIPTVSRVPPTVGRRGLSLSLETPKGQILLEGCSHAGIEAILEAARAIGERVYLVVGGLHLLFASDPEIERLATALRERWKVDWIAPGHCTGEPAFAILQKVFGEHYLYAGLGTVLEIP